MPNANAMAVNDLCKTLETIDIINMENFDLSCFLLVSGSTFDESTIKIGQTTLLPDNDNNGKLHFTNLPNKNNIFDLFHFCFRFV